MKKTLLYISLILVALVLGSCTRNHGDIGIWFGTWHVEYITTGGDIYQFSAPVDIEGDYFFQFQSKVFRVSQVTDHEQTVESFGTWDDEGEKMIIDFPDELVFYIQMPGLEAHNTFTVADATSRKATFTKVTADGTTFTYHLKKQP